MIIELTFSEEINPDSVILVQWWTPSQPQWSRQSVCWRVVSPERNTIGELETRSGE